MSDPDSHKAEAFAYSGNDDDGIIGMTRADLARGTLDECLAAVWRQPDDVRAMAYITTEGWTYVPDEIEAMRRDAGQ